MEQDSKVQMDGEYLILQKDMTLSELEKNMLLHNTITCLLPMQLQTFNGEEQFYYAISGLKPLVSDTLSNKLQLQDILLVLDGIYQLRKQISDYFLKIDAISLDLRMIYLDERGCRFCYLSGHNESFEDKLFTFSQQLLAYVDYQQEQAVSLCYRFHMLLTDGKKSIDEILADLLQEETKEELRQENQEDGVIHNDQMETKDFLVKATEEGLQGKVEVKTEQSFLTGKTWDLSGFLIFFILCVGSMGLFVYDGLQQDNIFQTKYLLSAESLFCLVFFVAGIVGILFSLGMVSRIRNGVKIKNKEKSMFIKPKKTGKMSEKKEKRIIEPSVIEIPDL